MADVGALLTRVSSPQPGEEGIAVFDADGTLWDGDIQETLLHRLIAARGLRGVDYAGDVFEDEYASLLRRDPTSAMARGVTLLAGLSLAEVQQHVRALLAEEFLAARYGEVRRLVDGLRERGYALWIVSASAQEVVQVAAADVGFAPQNVIGIRVEMQLGCFTDRVLPPVTVGPGKVAAIDARIGRRPDVVCGNGLSDVDMMATARVLAIAVNPAPGLREVAAERNWPVLEVERGG